MRNQKLRPLSTPMYGNGLMLDPDGRQMCRMDEKRLRWYLERDLATMVGADPLVIRLKFSPKGDGNYGDKFLLAVRENACVVCGTGENLTRHHIVPHCYRRLMPDGIKRHSAYDVMPLCVHHHVEYEAHAFQLRKDLSQKYDAPTNNLPSDDDTIGSVGGIAKTLLKYRHKIPADRVAVLTEKVAKFLGIMEVTDDHLRGILETKRRSIPHHHSQVVMSKVTDLDDFIKMWRKHFIETMQPKFLPKQWDPERIMKEKDDETKEKYNAETGAEGV